MRIVVEHTIGGLERDLVHIARTARTDMARTVRDNARAGNRIAADHARRTAGTHGKHYPKAFSAEAITALEWEYGPDAAMPQGGMSFNGGSRNQPPHLDLEKSQDIIGPKFAEDVARLPERWFWPGAS